MEYSYDEPNYVAKTEDDTGQSTTATTAAENFTVKTANRLRACEPTTMADITWHNIRILETTMDDITWNTMVQTKMQNDSIDFNMTSTLSSPGKTLSNALPDLQTSIAPSHGLHDKKPLEGLQKMMLAHQYEPDSIANQMISHIS